MMNLQFYILVLIIVAVMFRPLAARTQEILPHPANFLPTSLIHEYLVLDGYNNVEGNITYQQYLNMLENLNLYGTWYSNDNTSETGNFITRSFGFVSLETGLKTVKNQTQYSLITLKMYDGDSVATKFIIFEFYFENLYANLKESLFFGQIIANTTNNPGNQDLYTYITDQDTPIALPCSLFLQMQFINTTTNSPLTQVPSETFSNTAISFNVSQSNCSLSLTVPSLTNQPLSDSYFNLYIIAMGVSLLIGTLSGLIMLCQFPRNASKLKTTTVLSMWMIAAWQLFMLYFHVSHGYGYADVVNKWFLILGAISLVNCYVLIRVSKLYLVVTSRERSYQSNTKSEWYTGLIPSLAVCAAYVYATSNPKYLDILLISCFYMLPQIAAKCKHGRKAEVNWIFNIGFYFSQIFFVGYMYLYPDNMFNSPNNTTFGGVFIGLTSFEAFILLVSSKSRTKPRVEDQSSDLNENEYSDEFQGQQALFESEEKSEGKNNQLLMKVSALSARRLTRQSFLSEECSICAENFTKAPVDPTRYQIDPNDKNAAIITPCRHLYHRMCLLMWYSRQKNCPFCRQDLSSFEI